MPSLANWKNKYGNNSISISIESLSFDKRINLASLCGSAFLKNVAIFITKVPSSMAFFLYLISEFNVGGFVCPSRIARFHSLLSSKSIGLVPSKIPDSKSSIFTLRSSNIHVVLSKVIGNLTAPLI